MCLPNTRPTHQPPTDHTLQPSNEPNNQLPTKKPTNQPPTNHQPNQPPPTIQPTNHPTNQPTNQPTNPLQGFLDKNTDTVFADQRKLIESSGDPTIKTLMCGAATDEAKRPDSAGTKFRRSLQVASPSPVCLAVVPSPTLFLPLFPFS
jgi:hypothetical protein